MKFIIHNFQATIQGGVYEFDFYEYSKNGMIVCDTMDLDIAILLPNKMKDKINLFMIGAIKNYFNNIGVHSCVRMMGSLQFNAESFKTL